MELFTDTSIKPSSVANPSYKGGNNENELNPEMASKLEIPNKKQHLPTKNFMNPTISAATKATVPKKKILGERNETLDENFQVLDPDNHVEKERDSVAKKSLQEAYDPVKNYLSPRPKFLRYNPNRRRNILNLQENENCAKNSCSFDAGYVLGLGSSSDSCSSDSCSQKESVEETEDVINQENDSENDEYKDNEEDEVEDEVEDDDKIWSFMGFLKGILVVIALMLTTQAICSMNSPDNSHTLGYVYRFNGWYNNVYTAASLNFSQVILNDHIREAENICQDYEGVDMIKNIQEFVEIQDEEIDGDEIENEEIDFVQENFDKLQEQEIIENEVVEIIELFDLNQNGLIENQEIKASEMVEVVETEIEVFDINQDDLVKDAEFENDENIEEINDIKASDVLIKLANFDQTIRISIGFFLLFLTTFGVVYGTNRTKSSSCVEIKILEKEEIKILEKEEIKILEKQEFKILEKEEIKILESNVVEKDDIKIVENITKSSFLIQSNDVCEEISSFHAPTVELLGEFVYGEDITTVSFSQTKSTGDSNATTKKQRRKNVEVSSMVTPSPVRRSSRLQNRSIKSP